MTRIYILLELDCKKEVPDLTDKVADRAYRLDGVENATALLLDSRQSFRLAREQMEASHGPA